MDSSIAAKRRAAALERVLKAIGSHRVVPSTKASPLERELFLSEILAELSERVAALTQRLDALDRRVAALEAKPRRKALAKAD